MAKAAHNRKFIHKALFSIFCGKCILFGKGLDSKFFRICKSFNLINRGEISFSKFLNRFEHFVKPFLVDEFRQMNNP